MPPREAVGMDVTALRSMFSECGTFLKLGPRHMVHIQVPAGAPRAGMDLTAVFHQGPGSEVQYSREPSPGSTPYGVLPGAGSREYCP